RLSFDDFTGNVRTWTVLFAVLGVGLLWKHFTTTNDWLMMPRPTMLIVGGAALVLAVLFALRVRWGAEAFTTFWLANAAVCGFFLLKNGYTGGDLALS